MKIQPRQRLLEIWQATARIVLQDGEWHWGGRYLPNSVSDAEQLLCIMYPASAVASFKLDLPDETADDVLGVLRNLGDAVEIPRLLVRAVTTYLRTYTSEEGAPRFSGGSYFDSDEPGRDPTPEQTDLDVVDAFSMSITLMLATIGFARVFRTAVRREDLRTEIDELEALASRRLTAAMVGLLRSFTVKVFPPDSPAGHTLISTVNQADAPQRMAVEELQRALREVRAGIRDFTIGSGRTSELDNPNQLFECGWSWGVVKDAPEIDTEDIGPQPQGVAQPDPYLYFTVNALDGIADLFSERTTVLGLLSEEQVRLAQALRLRWELTQSYWSIIATFGQERWPLEDLPWRTTDEQESDYFSLLVTSMVVQDLHRRRATDADLRRVGDILEELAERGRITRRATRDDPAIKLHSPGVRLTLDGSEELGGPRLGWQVSDYSAVLLKRALKVAGMARSTQLRDTVIGLVGDIWSHVLRRRIPGGDAQNLWDRPANLFPTALAQGHDAPSWYYTERIIECLVEAAGLIGSAPIRSVRLSEIALDLLNEAEHLFDDELLSGSSEAGPAMRDSLYRTQASIVRAREVISTRPGTAFVLASEVLRELDRLTVARRDASGAT